MIAKTLKHIKYFEFKYLFSERVQARRKFSLKITLIFQLDNRTAYVDDYCSYNAYTCTDILNCSLETCFKKSAIVYVTKNISHQSV